MRGLQHGLSGNLHRGGSSSTSLENMNNEDQDDKSLITAFTLHSVYKEPPFGQLHEPCKISLLIGGIIGTTLCPEICDLVATMLTGLPLPVKNHFLQKPRLSETVLIFVFFSTKEFFFFRDLLLQK